MTDLSPLHVLGGGPAGSTAALAAIEAGARVRIYEKSQFPRHKVCGEFLSPEVTPVLERLALLGRFQSLRPASIGRVICILAP